MLVVNPNNRIRTNLAAIETPLWAGLCASAPSSDILDAEALNLSFEDTVSAIKKYDDTKVLLVVMGNNPSVSSTPKMSIAQKLYDALNDLDVYMTGIHPIATQSEHHYKVIQTPFEGLPSVPYHKLPMHIYKAHNWHCFGGLPREGYASIYTSMGCPYDCYYCNIHTLYNSRELSLRPIPDIANDLAVLAKYSIKNLKIWDELFAVNTKRVTAICDVLKQYHFNTWAYARVDTVTSEMLTAMKKAGINWLCYGFESADINVRKGIHKTYAQSKVDEVVAMTKDAGIHIIANFMFGLPGEAEDSMQTTMDWAKSKLFEFVNLYEAKPYPGSKWYADTKPTHPLGYYDQYGKHRMKFRDQAFKEYFTNPDYLSMIKRTFGDIGVQEVKTMLGDEFFK